MAPIVKMRSEAYTVDFYAAMLKEIGVLALLLEADHNAPRVFSEEQAATRLAAFVEMLV